MTDEAVPTRSARRVVVAEDEALIRLDVVEMLRDAGFEVVYTGIRRKPAEIAAAAVQEDVQIVGLSILSGAHVSLTRKTIEALREAGADDILVVVGGTIPSADVSRLKELGAAEVYPTGTELDVLVQSMRELCSQASASST
jgi:methylmalonyl-CoA mutase C-terminal domain/subunit